MSKKIFSPYELIEFEYEGETFQVKYPLTIEIMKEVDEFETKAADGDLDAMTEQLVRLTTVPIETAKKIDFVALTGMLKYCHDEVENRILVGTAKNGSKPTDPKSEK